METELIRKAKKARSIKKMDEKNANEAADRLFQMRLDKRITEEDTKREQYVFALKRRNELVLKYTYDVSLYCKTVHYFSGMDS